MHSIIFLRVWLVENIENIKNNADKLIDINYPDDIENDFIEVLQFKNIICSFSIKTVQPYLTL